MKRPRVWGLPCPTSCDDEALNLPYRIWFWLYASNQRARHVVGLHQRPHTYSIAPRCDWCGHRSRKQRAIADANRTAT